MGLVAGYIFMGSLLFGVWENWDWLTSAYYCFVTISTIGFGDLVPGSEGFQTTADNLKMTAASAYIVFGLAIMSMAFNLIQVKVSSLWDVKASLPILYLHAYEATYNSTTLPILN